MIQIKIPVKHPDGTITSKSQVLTKPVTGKNCYSNGSFQKHVSTVESMAVLGARITNTIERGNYILAVGQLPVIETGMDIKIPIMSNEGMRTAEVYNEGKIRDHTGYWTAEVSYEKSRSSAKQKMIDLKARKGVNWKNITERENRGVAKKLLQRGYSENRKEINDVKAVLINKDIANEMQNYAVRNLEKNVAEYNKLKTINYKAQITMNLRQVSEGKLIISK